MANQGDADKPKLTPGQIILKKERRRIKGLRLKEAQDELAISKDFAERARLRKEIERLSRELETIRSELADSEE